LTVTSTSIKEPIDGLLLSNVFRSGVSSLVKSLSRELASDSIRINNLVPGRIDTERVKTLDAVNATKKGISEEQQRSLQQASIPLGRYGLPSEFGAAAAFLLSDAASYLTGATLVVDGGKTVSVW
jgi:3-oxoacyl-[acyl-carrier protein] reductase